MSPIVENGFLVIWVIVLVGLSRRNNNLNFILVLMLIPKLIDVVMLTPLLQDIKHTDIRHHFFIYHSLNDGLMCLFMFFRYWISLLLFKQFVYRRIYSEIIIIIIYGLSVFINIKVFNEYIAIYDGQNIELFYFNNYEKFKGLLNYLEVALLTGLTVQTILAVRKLRSRGLIK